MFKKISFCRGQSIIEYTIIIGIVTIVLYYMGTGVKRGVQSLVKVTADQVGNQADADQTFNDTRQGYLQSSNSVVQDAKSKQVLESASIADTGVPMELANTIYNDATTTMTNTITNGGFSSATQ